eukprot:TRINITY_DN5130_c0_g2_i6.p1 TRINITY_DN5130_c0_g2~~TRINITY_DN5130_c0_g2_i6.p1  ORF type:complete len:119 (+),score=18.71 TRINITY_DN5130_c0_g2_i6:134-490(+)
MGLGWSQQEGGEEGEEACPQQLMPIERAMEKPMEKPTEKTMEKPLEKAMAKPKKLPHNYQAIMQETDSPLEATSEELYPRLHYGVFLSHKRKASPSSNPTSKCKFKYFQIFFHLHIHI